MLFSSTKNGWERKDWIKAVEGKGLTITLFRSPKRLAGGYLDIPWENRKEISRERDHEAFLFSIESRIKLSPVDS
jgi:hypothetical protein